MIGNTKGLVDACAEADRQSIGRIETVTELPLNRHYVRMGISTFQDDTAATPTHNIYINLQRSKGEYQHEWASVFNH
jgi:hypothetical protein